MEDLDGGGGWLSGGAKFLKTHLDTEFHPRKLFEILSSLERDRESSHHFLSLK